MPPRHFLFLQGPHGPFFRQLAAGLRAAGAKATKIGFNGGDAAFWWPVRGYRAHRRSARDWPDTVAGIMEQEAVTDLVVYGEWRTLHDTALKAARERGITTHIFEEGYLRPYWVTYERDGTNGASPLRSIPLSAMRSQQTLRDAPEHATSWGELRQHVFYGATYHAALMAGRPFYPRYVGHRDISVPREALLNILRFVAMPAHAAQRRAATARIRLGGYPYHLALLQLEHDASFRAHAPYPSITDFAEEVIAGFAAGAPMHHHLIFKAHPLEDGRSGIRRAVKGFAQKAGMESRVHFLRGGKLAGLLDDTLSAVTINSTAGQQVLRRGIPLKTLGTAVYSGRGFTSDQSLSDFFADPRAPDLEAYMVFRRYQLETCQIQGGYYSALGRARLLRRAVDLLLAPQGPYVRLAPGASTAQHLRIVG